jgi:DnaJ-class molecular chaperone
MECLACDGTGVIMVLCQTCRGTGWVGGREGGEICCGGWDTADCMECGGTGEVDEDE